MSVSFTSEFGKANVMVAEGHAYADEIMTMVILDKSQTKDIVVYLDPEEDEGIFVSFLDQPCARSLSKYDNRKLCRPNGVKYSSCGIAWMLYGREVVKRFPKSEEVWRAVDEGLIQEIDRVSNLQFDSEEEMPCFGKTFSEKVFALNQKYPYEKRELAYEEAVELCTAKLNQAIKKAIIG